MNKWTVETIQKEADKYQTRKEFKKGSPNAYQAACNRKIMDNVCKHMKPYQQ